MSAVTLRVYRVNDSGRVSYMHADGRATTYKRAATFSTEAEADAAAFGHGWETRISIATTESPTTTAEYAAVLADLVRADLEREPERFGQARAWVDLHDVADANEYLIEASEITGHNPDMAFMDAAINLAEQDLWPS